MGSKGVLLRSIIACCAGVFAASICGATVEAQPAPAFNWTGYYAGWDFGRIGGDNTFTVIRSSHPNPEAYTFGFHGGYRFHFTNHIVLGWEGAAAMFFRGESGALFPGLPREGGLLAFNWDASARVTLGYAFDRSLLYVAGGLALLDLEGCGGSAGGAGGRRRGRRGRGAEIHCVPGSYFGDVRVGLTIGAGIAHAVAERLILRIEYLFSDYGTERYLTPAATGSITEVSVRTHAVRLGIIYRFGQ